MVSCSRTKVPEFQASTVSIWDLKAHNTIGVDFVKNIWGQPKYWGEGVAITDESIGVSQLLGARARAAPKSTPMYSTHSNGQQQWSRILSNHFTGELSGFRPYGHYKKSYSLHQRFSTSGTHTPGVRQLLPRGTQEKIL